MPCPSVSAARRWLRPALASLAITLIAGCATAPSNHRLAPQAAQHAPVASSVWVAPIDAELSELTAGGALEPRADWTQTATQLLRHRLCIQKGFTEHRIATEPDPELVREVEDVQALLRAMSLNRVYTTGPLLVNPPADPQRPFDYETGPLAAHAAAGGHRAVLFVFVRDSYATAGRKALMALSFVGAAFTGVYIAPAMGSTLSSAALVDHEGHVLWMNHDLGSYDLRTEQGVAELLDRLLTELPLAAGTAGA